MNSLAIALMFASAGCSVPLLCDVLTGRQLTKIDIWAYVVVFIFLTLFLWGIVAFAK